MIRIPESLSSPTIMQAKAQRNMKVLARCQDLRGFASEMGYKELTMRHSWGAAEQGKCRRKPESSRTLSEALRFGSAIGFGKSLGRSRTVISPPSPPTRDPKQLYSIQDPCQGTAGAVPCP